MTLSGDQPEFGSYTTSALLADDDAVLRVLGPELADLAQRPGFVLDGFPRRLSQAFLLDDMLDGVASIDAAVYLDVSIAAARARLRERTTCAECGVTYSRAQIDAGHECLYCTGRVTRRGDDNDSKIMDRMHTFEEYTVPVLELYDRRGFLRCVNGEGSADVVTRRVIEMCARERSAGT